MANYDLLSQTRRSPAGILVILAVMMAIFQEGPGSSRTGQTPVDLSLGLGSTSRRALSFRQAASVQFHGPLRVNPINPRYFTDDSGRAIYLTGCSNPLTWRDIGVTDPPTKFDFDQWLDFLQANGLNLTEMYSFEQSRWLDEGAGGDAFLVPPWYKRTGPGNALDGKPKFNLDSLNQDLFDTLRSRVVRAGQRGIYVEFFFFYGFSVDSRGGHANAWMGHPYNKDNNINGINGDSNGDGNGYETETLDSPSITSLQMAFIRKAIDAVNDLDNVFYSVANEGQPMSGEIAWEDSLVQFIKTYEMRMPKQHPVGRCVQWHNNNNSDLFSSPADWVMYGNYPYGYTPDPPDSATGKKVVLANTDHLCGICGSESWVWKSFTRGENPLYFDTWNNAYPFLDPAGPDSASPTVVALRKSLGYTRMYANRLDLNRAVPRPSLTNTGYCLANPTPPSAEYLVYLPSGGSSIVDLSESRGTFLVEWFNPSTGDTTDAGTVSAGMSQIFVAPFSGDAVLYLLQSAPAGMSPTTEGKTESYALCQNFPNPFNPVTKIIYTLPRRDRVLIQVYDLVGHLVCTLINQTEDSGSWSVVWNGKDQVGKSVSSGVYLCRMEASSFTSTIKLLMLK